jgi:inhibitor of KinA
MNLSPNYEIYPLGDMAITVRLSTQIIPEMNEQVQQFASLLITLEWPGIMDVVPSFSSVAIYYDPLWYSYHDIHQRIVSLLQSLPIVSVASHNIIEIPVCYGGEFGQDLSLVARERNLSEQEVIEIHSTAIYVVYAVGFSPGFPYLGGLSDQLIMPRRNEPRLSVPVGSVAIAGKQTGIYPLSTPGGWHLIGRTPVNLIRPTEHPPCLLHPGDRVRFVAIDDEQFRHWGSDPL